MTEEKNQVEVSLGAVSGAVARAGVIDFIMRLVLPGYIGVAVFSKMMVFVQRQSSKSR